MKFSHSLKFNAVPEWQDNYVNYPALKKVVYKLQQDQLGSANAPSDGSIPVDLVNRTTVSELVDTYKFKRVIKEGDENAEVDEFESDEPSVQPANGRFKPSKFINRFKKSAPAVVDSDLEKVAGSTTSAAEFTDGNSQTMEKNASSTESFTVELDNSTIVSFRSTNAKKTPGAASEKDYSDPKSESFDPLKVFSKQLLLELQKINDFFQSKEVEVFKGYDNLIKDLETNNVNIDDVFKFTQAYHYDNPDVVSTDDHHQYHIKSTLSRVTTHASVFDHINHLDNDFDKELQNADLEKQSHVHVEEDEDDEDEDDDDEDDDNHSEDSVLLSHTDFNVKQQMKITLRKKSIALFISMSELKSFIELNKIGFTKICKKFDKTCNYAIKDDFIKNYLPNNSRVFYPETIEDLDYKLGQLVKIYAFLSGRLTSKTTTADLESVKADLRSHLRDHIVWERNTVWKDLLSLEKKTYNLELNGDSTQTKMGEEGHLHNSLMHMRFTDVKLPISVFGHNHVKIPSSLLTAQVVKLLVIITVFVILLCVKTFNDPVQGRCLALLVACAMLWASEALPLFTTALFVPLLVVTMKVCKVEGTNEPMSGTAASQYILGTMWNSTIMILIGGFTLAAALSKYNIAKVLSSYILAFAGTKPRNVLISIMSVALFLSMWISNVAAPVLCFSLIQPVLRSVPTDSPVAQAMVLGIALASNVAGMASPIASPQNVVALQFMSPNPGWGKWFAVALPVAIIAMVGIWLELIFTFKINNVKLKAYKPIKEKFTTKQIFISVVTVVTIILWCVMTKIDSTFGESGIISFIPIVLFFGTGLLKADDINNYPWSIVLLAMGGIALGKAVSSSGLLATIAMALQRRVMDYNAFVVLLIFGILILVVATFVSHTVAALIILPLVKEVGDALPTPHSLMLVMGTALIASSAMGLPTSGFPNVTAISMTDEVGKRYLTVNTFITRGVPASLIAYIVIITIGYGIMNALKF
ncbi:phosphate permease [Scheffersomyces xylosifermentans]|uniref:phosphate permease n=1 Tax=Scheffersomyces xylosifermentans TaxID=1304137 RepID=UPI00315DEAFF